MKKHTDRAKWGEIPTVPFTAQSSETTARIKTGAWRNIEPFYKNVTPPCVGDCLAGEDVVRQLTLVSEDKFTSAVELLREANPFPAICGRVCPHPCELNCSRAELGGVIKIHMVERFLGDYSIEKGMQYQPRAKRKEKIAVVGSGPAGLSCAFYLAQEGFHVIVFESLDVIGGLLRTGIPPYRLPREVLDSELKIFGKLPVTFEFKKQLGVNISLDELKRFDASFISIGRYASRRLGLDNESAPQVYEGVNLLRSIHCGSVPSLGKTVIIIGGGNTALDCARSVLRLGCQPIIVYRRTENEMPAFKEEIEEAKEEGIKIITLAVPIQIKLKGSKLASVEFVRMELGKSDASGRPTPVPIQEDNFTLDADSLVKATGEIADLELLKSVVKVNQRGVVIDDNFSTPIAGVFSGGDCVGITGTVAEAIRDGRVAAASIEKYLTDTTNIKVNIANTRGVQSEPFDKKRLNTTYIENAMAVASHRVSPQHRIGSFCEVYEGFTRGDILYEAGRCISCGTCTLCDNCLVFCPDRAVKRNSSGYHIDYDYCKGCAICVEECPRGAIYMRGASKNK
ncbi:FAD-dependent oxidoreductase [Candidatus Peregrinibacteria bacterium]|nr:FAD-dependent oxidoreductase [Candidatus Peregrinibacteria bacterium]